MRPVRIQQSIYLSFKKLLEICPGTKLPESLSLELMSPPAPGPQKSADVRDELVLSINPLGIWVLAAAPSSPWGSETGFFQHHLEQSS